METTPTIADLLAGVACRCGRAFDELYTRVFDRVLTTVKRQLVDDSQSEEVAQEVMLEVWEKAEQFDTVRGSGLAWILTMARRRAIDRVRASQSSRDRDDLVGRRDRPVDFDVVAEQVQSRLETERLIVALKAITPLQREAIVTSYLGGASIAETALRVGASEAAVKMRLHDGMRKLRDQLGDRAA